jgi:chromosome segregation ATPase
MSGNATQNAETQVNQEVADMEADAAGLYLDEAAGASAAIADQQQRAQGQADPAEPTGDQQQQQGDAGNKGHGFDKGLQQTQQRVSALDAKLDGLSTSIQQLVDRLGNQSASPSQAQQQVDQAQQQADDLTDALKDLADNDWVEAKHVRTLTAKLAAVTKDLDAMKQAQTEQTSTRQVDEFWSNWEKQHPTIAGQRQELVTQASDWVQQKYPGLNQDAYRERLQTRFDMLVEQAESAAGSGQQQQAAPAKPKTQAPTRPTEGTRVTQPGASQGPAGQNANELDMPFEDDIKGLYAPNE